MTKYLIHTDENFKRRTITKNKIKNGRRKTT